jgi:hypothetical protein
MKRSDFWATKVLQLLGTISLKIPSESWARKWLAGHPEMDFRKLRKVDRKRAEACKEANLKAWFEQVQNKINPRRPVLC